MIQKVFSEFFMGYEYSDSDSIFGFDFGDNSDDASSTYEEYTFVEPKLNCWRKRKRQKLRTSNNQQRYENGLNVTEGDKKVSEGNKTHSLNLFVGC